MSKPYKDFSPNWYLTTPPEKSYRSIFKWGDPNFNKFPKETLYKMLKETFHMTDDDFKTYRELGLEEVHYDKPITLKPEQLKAFEAIVGKDNVKTDDYSRLSIAYGKTMYDLLRLRKKIIENIPDAVLYPSTKEEIEKIVAYCSEALIPIYVYGGGSSVTRGMECMKPGGITLDMRKNFNKVIEFNEVNQTITVQAGMSGPRLEEVLNNAVNEFGAKRSYTCGHFPQSFEYSCVGGWTVTRGAGQNSTYFGKIEDIVLGQEYATPIGVIKTAPYPASATGPSINHIMMGNEGTFGVLTHVTLKVFKYMPENQLRFSYMFKNWQDAQNAAREIMQGQFGFPSVFRLSDPEETDVMMKLYGIEETPLNKLLKMRGFKEMEKCLFLGFTDGELGFCKNLKRKVHRVCKKYGAMSLTGLPVKGWEKGRFNDPYMRDTMQDFGVMTDTLECTVTWDKMSEVHKMVRAYCKSRPNTICMTHMSHVYPQGANLYFIFIAKMTELEDFSSYHRGILDHIQKSGAAMSHHHGIGKMFAPWLEGQIGTQQMNVYKALKAHFDPNGIMNPGGTIGLDLKEEEKRFIRPKW
ncbi:MAG: FAD-binding oxidoreductase [Cellulosilyticaceae bacterium]